MDNTEKKKEMPAFICRILPYIQSYLVPTAVLSGIWLVLGWIYSAGVYGGFFRVLDFITGSLNGLFGSVVGGIVGRTIFAVCLQELTRELMTSGDSFSVRMKRFVSSFRNDVLKKIPQYTNIAYFYGEKDIELLGCGILGAGLALFVYPFITSSGALVNSSVLILIFFALIKDVAGGKGLVKVLLHAYFSRNRKSVFRSDAADRLLTGFAIGSAASLIPAVIRQAGGSVAYTVWWFAVRILPAVMIAAGIAAVICARTAGRKEKAE